MAERSVTIKLTLDGTSVDRAAPIAAANIAEIEKRARAAGMQLDALNLKLGETATASMSYDTAMGKIKVTVRDVAIEQDKLNSKAEAAGRQFRKTGDDSSMLAAALRTAKDQVASLTKEFEKSGSEETLKGLRAARSEVRALEADMRAAAREASLLGGGGPGGPGGANVVSRGLGSIFNVSPELAALIGATIAAGAPAIGAALNGALLTGVGMGGITLGIIGQLHNPILKTAFADFGTEFHQTLIEATRDLAGPLASGIGVIGGSINNLFGAMNFDTIAKEIEPLAVGLSGLIQALGPGLRDAALMSLPLMHEFANDLPKIGVALSDLLHNVAASQGSAQGLRFLVDLTANLIEFLGRLLNVLGSLFVWLQELKPLIGLVADSIGVAASAVGLLAKGLGMIGPTATLAIAALILLHGRVGDLADRFTGFGSKVREVSAAHEEAASSTRRFATTLGVLSAAGGVAKSSLGSLVGFLGGPWGVAFTVATLALGYISEQEAKQKQATEQLMESLRDLGKEYNNSHTVTTKYFQDIVAGNDQLRDIALNAGKYGVSIGQIAKAAGGSKQDLDAFYAAMTKANDAFFNTPASKRTQQIIDTYEAYKNLAPAITDAYKQAVAYKQVQDLASQAQNNATETSHKLTQAAIALGTAYHPLVDLLGVLGDETRMGADAHAALGQAIQEVSQQVAPANVLLKEYSIITMGIGSGMENSIQMAGDFSTVLGNLEHTALSTADRMTLLAEVFNNVASAQISAADKAKLLGQAWTDLRGPAIDVEKATDNYNKLLLEMEGTYTKNAKGVTTYSGSLDANSRSLSQNDLAGIKNRETLIQLAEASHQMYLADVASGIAEDEARKKEILRNQTLVDQAVKTGLNRQETQKLLDKFAEIPASKVTTVTVTPRNFDQIYNDLLNTLLAQYMAMHPGVTRQEAQRYYRTEGMATGGPIVGIGGPKQDNIPIWASAGEFMQQADAVDYYGVHFMQAINEKRVPKEVFLGMGNFALPGLASGGLVDTVNKFGRYTHALAQWAPNFPVPVEFNKSIVPSADPWTYIGGPLVGAALSFLMAQVGKPYIWASAGPGGYDCSGIVSAVWNILHGRSPYSHTFSTFNEAGFFPIPGAGGVLTAGWANPGERGGGSVGHTAASLAGHMFESTGSRGVHVSGVTPLSSFAHLGHFDAGGYLMPGWNLSWNGTGRMEQVKPPRGQFVSGGGTTIIRHEHIVVIEGTGVLRGLRQEIRAQGGDVQEVLGP